MVLSRLKNIDDISTIRSCIRSMPILLEYFVSALVGNVVDMLLTCRNVGQMS